MELKRILLPTRPQPDTIVAIFLLRQFGAKQFPGIETAEVEVRHALASGDTFENLLERGELALDVGGGPLDHHGKSDTYVSGLVALRLGIEKDPGIKKLLSYAQRDDRDGKGTLSSDPLDKAFGLSGLIASLNKQYPEDPNTVVSAVLPLLTAHYLSSREHHVDLPSDIEKKKRTGAYEQIRVKQGDRTFRIAFVISDKPSMPTFLRSYQGGAADVVVQKSEQTNHICIVSRQEQGIDLSRIMALIRLQEAETAGIKVRDDLTYLCATGRIDEVPHWYFDPATNSLLNGGTHNKEVPESNIRWEDLKKIVKVGLEIGSATAGARSAYYLSVPIQSEVAEAISSKLSVPKQVQMHDPKNMHITLEYFGSKTPDEAQEISKKLSSVLSQSFESKISLSDTNLTVGAPEGYPHAWFLNLEKAEGASSIHALRQVALTALGLPLREKALHITLATKKNLGTSVPDDSVTFSTPFSIHMPVRELVLMESREEAGQRTHVPHTSYPLTH